MVAVLSANVRELSGKTHVLGTHVLGTHVLGEYGDFRNKAYNPYVR
jgi:hypothetical protein